MSAAAAADADATARAAAASHNGARFLSKDLHRAAAVQAAY